MRTSPPALYQWLGWAPSGDLADFTLYTNKRGKRVIFIKAPPKEPASYWQKVQRNRWVLFAAAWRALPDSTRSLWVSLPRLAHLTIGGYNLFVWYQTTLDTATMATICRRAGVNPEDLT